MNYISNLMTERHIDFNKSFYIADAVNGNVETKEYHFNKDYALKFGSITHGTRDDAMLIELLKGNKIIVNSAAWNNKPNYGQIYYYMVDDAKEYGKFTIKKKAWNNNLVDLINLKAGNIFHSDNKLSRSKQNTLYNNLLEDAIKKEKSIKKIV